MVTGMVQFLAF